MKYEGLKHIRRPLSRGGQVFVLDTGAVVNAEEEAMLQALHSRSIGGIDSHFLKLAKSGAANFMDMYYVKYDEKSIGDCGTITMFIEGVSMLAAKAVQDSQLYNGQESSTRYIDFSKQPFIDPHNNTKNQDLLESLRDFYLAGTTEMKEVLAVRHPWDSSTGQNQDTWQKAINARAFDIMRGFLPAGAMTNLAWHSELRHAADHLLRLRHHPLGEVREIANMIGDALSEKLSHSGFLHKRYPATEAYVERWMQQYYFFDQDFDIPYADGGRWPAVGLDRSTIDKPLLREFREVLASRPVKAELPKFLAEAGTMRFRFGLDYGSFRDIQRQRAINQRMPLLTDWLGFGQWYFDQLSDGLRNKAVEFLHGYAQSMTALGVSAKSDYTMAGAPEAQYFIPMGYQVSNRITGDLPAHVWWVELRSGARVHPTLRTVAHGAADIMLDRLQDTGLVLHIDRSPDQFNVKRGNDDIVEKAPAA
jgi:thymidylate synthase ThyX